jgi:hypothetical protein
MNKSFKRQKFGYLLKSNISRFNLPSMKPLESFKFPLSLKKALFDLITI